MALLIKPLPCPHCGQAISKQQLQEQGKLKAFLKSKAFACPHCEQETIFPENADQVLSIGLLITVIVAPLCHLAEVELIDSRLLLALGIITIIGGIFTQKLKKA